MASVHPLGPGQWFEKAVRSYTDRHQACAWCGACHCVLRARLADRIEYSCNECEFFTCHNFQTGRYYYAPGLLQAKPVGR